MKRGFNPSIDRAFQPLARDRCSGLKDYEQWLDYCCERYVPEKADASIYPDPPYLAGTKCSCYLINGE